MLIASIEAACFCPKTQTIAMHSSKATWRGRKDGIVRWLKFRLNVEVEGTRAAKMCADPGDPVRASLAS
jgi:hypothetical protein